MSLVPWSAFRELEEMNERLNRAFGNSLYSKNGRSEFTRESMRAVDWAPHVDVAETTEDYQIKVEVPGVNKDDVKVTVNNGILRVEGERHQEKEENGKKYHRIERSYGSFLRTFTLPENIDETLVRAEYKDGVLNVRIPKTERAKPKSIDVKVL